MEKISNFRLKKLQQIKCLRAILSILISSRACFLFFLHSVALFWNLFFSSLAITLSSLFPILNDLAWLSIIHFFNYIFIYYKKISLPPPCTIIEVYGGLPCSRCWGGRAQGPDYSNSPSVALPIPDYSQKAPPGPDYS